jgi:hypothetical protein
MHDGRLKFADVPAFIDTVNQLSALPADQLSPDHFATRFPGFVALGMVERDARPDVPDMAATMTAVLNHQSTYQIADRIFMVLGDTEYVIPEGRAALVTALLAGAAPQPYVASGQIQAHRISRTVTDSISTIAPGTVESLLNAKYQSPFSAGGVSFKFVDEAYVDVFGFYLMACFRAKLQYYDRSWKDAGERTYKEIDNATVNYLLNPGATFAVSSPLSDARNDSNNLVVCAQITPPVGFCATGLQLTAFYYSEGTANNIAGHSYQASAQWLSEFTGQVACN